MRICRRRVGTVPSSSGVTERVTLWTVQSQRSAVGRSLSRVVNRLKLKMTALDGVYAVCRLDTPSSVPGSSVPGWVCGAFWSITQTSDELSIVCLQECVPSRVSHEGGWSVLKVLGPLSFALTGIVASISRALAEAGISIFALSTYDTDYVLVKADQLESAIEALRRQGVEFA